MENIPSVEKNYWLKSLDTTSLEPINQNIWNKLQILEPTNNVIVSLQVI